MGIKIIAYNEQGEIHCVVLNESIDEDLPGGMRRYIEYFFKNMEGHLNMNGIDEKKVYYKIQHVDTNDSKDL